jgi:hypothetical protein
MALCFGLVRHAGGVGVIGANDLSMFNVAGACHRHGQCYGRGLGFITSLNTEDGFTRAVMDYILPRVRAMESQMRRARPARISLLLADVAGPSLRMTKC